MKQAVPAAQDLARQLLGMQAPERQPAPPQIDAALDAIEKLRLHLSKLVGVAGFHALLARALALAKAEVPWLDAVQVSAEGVLEGFTETALKQKTEDAA